MFIPSMLKSLQVIAAGPNATTNPLDVTIASVDPSYTRISKAGGAIFQFTDFRIELTSATNIRMHNFTNSGGNPSHDVRTKLLVEEYIPTFFRQAFYYNKVDIATGQRINTLNTGLTFGSKAMVISLGFSWDFTVLAAYEVSTQLSLSGGTVTAEQNIAHSNAGTLSCGFLIMDPK